MCGRINVETVCEGGVHKNEGKKERGRERKERSCASCRRRFSQFISVLIRPRQRSVDCWVRNFSAAKKVAKKVCI